MDGVEDPGALNSAQLDQEVAEVTGTQTTDEFMSTKLRSGSASAHGSILSGSQHGSERDNLFSPVSDTPRGKVSEFGMTQSQVLLSSDPKDFPYVCPTCGPSKRFLTLVGLWSHLENKHPYQKPEVPYRPGTETMIKDSTFTPTHSARTFSTPPRQRHLPPTQAPLYAAPSFQPLENTARNGYERGSGTLPNYFDPNIPERDYGPVQNGHYSTLQNKPATDNYSNLLRYNSMPVLPIKQNYNWDKLKEYDEMVFLVEKLRHEIKIKEDHVNLANKELEKLALDRRKIQREILDLSKNGQQNSEYANVLNRNMAAKDSQMKDKEREILELTQFIRDMSVKEADARGTLEEYINDLINKATNAEQQLVSMKAGQSMESLNPVPVGQNKKIPNNIQANNIQQNGSVVPHEALAQLQLYEEQSNQPTYSTVQKSPRNDFIDGQLSPVSASQNFGQPSVYADSGIGESIPSNGKNGDIHHHRKTMRDEKQILPTAFPQNHSFPQNPSTDDDVLREHEQFLVQQLNNVKEKRSDIQQKQKQKRLSSTDDFIEPPIDYSSGSGTDDIFIDTLDNKNAPQSHRSFSRSSPLQQVNAPVKATRKIPPLLGPNTDKFGEGVPTFGQVAKRRREALFCVFMYLDTATLSKISIICKDWKQISRHPALWRNIRIGKAKVGPRYLATISKWATQVNSLTLMGLRPRNKRQNEGSEEYQKSLKGSLESSLDQLIRVNSNTLNTIKIVDCRNILTDRCLWIASNFCPKLKQLVYVSESYPIGAEALWCLGMGCPNIKALIIPPIYPNERPDTFNDQACAMIGRCWPHLQILCIGGRSVTEKGLTAIANGCLRLQVLELDHMVEMQETTAVAMCSTGLKGLEALDFTFTPVTPKALVQFHSACCKLKTLSVHIGISDYFPRQKDNPEKKAEYQKLVTQLQTLQSHRSFAGILDLNTGYG